MSRMICVPSRRVKPARRTARSNRPFGAGLTHYIPFAVIAGNFLEPSDEDKAAAAAMFADDDDFEPADLELRAAAFRYYDACEAI